MPVPTIAFDSQRATADGIEFSFKSAVSPVVAPLIAVLAVALSLGTREAAPLLLALALPIAFLQSRWAFCYAGPSVRYTRVLFGVALWRSQYPLQDSDSTSVDLIEDTVFLIQRPRWYTLNLWSSALAKDRVVMLSNDPEELHRLDEMFNAAIMDVRAKAASSRD